jgi:gas vesicle protein
MSRRAAFLAGLALGALAGGAIALLTSPRTGRENRGLVVASLPVGAEEEGPGLFERASTAISERLDAGRQAYREAAAETRERMRRELDARQGDH